MAEMTELGDDKPQTTVVENNARRSGCWPFRRTRREDNIKQTCEKLKGAFDASSMGAIVETLQNLVSDYYQDVKDQANMSFDAALCAAAIGFLVLAVSVVYALVFDALNRSGTAPRPLQGSLTVSELGVISGALIEFIAGVAFWLYARGARQFYAFHVCLERTHRYLLAFKIADQMEQEKDKAFHELLCIMANAPMITPGDIGSEQTARPPTHNT